MMSTELGKFEINIDEYNFYAIQKDNELIEDFKIRVQEDLIKQNIPIEII